MTAMRADSCARGRPAGRYNAALARWLPVGLAAVMYALFLSLFWPGFRTSDSAEMWLQAHTGELTTVHAPVMSITWSVLDRLWPVAGNLFALHTLLLGVGFVLLALALFRRWPARVLLLLVLAGWPPLSASSAHIWKDIPMLAFFAMAVALFIAEHRRPARWMLHLAAGLLAVACLYRHNALPAALPLLYWYAHRVGVQGFPRKLALTAALAGAVLVLTALPARYPGVVERQVWPVVAVWDLAAVSIDTGQMLIPLDWRAADLGLAELEDSFRPWSNTSIFDGGKLLISLYVEPDQGRSRELLQAWFGLWVHQPVAMAGHRLRLTAYLLGIQRSNVPLAMHYAPGVVNVPGHARIELPPNRWRDAWSAFIASGVGSVLFLGYPYVAVTLLGWLAAWRRRDVLWQAITLSALMCVATLALFAPSAEFRYLLWPVLVALLVLGRLCKHLVSCIRRDDGIGAPGQQPGATAVVNGNGSHSSPEAGRPA